ncbi:MAG TPA: hypothetical protein ENK57_21465 [Polyangiaceae bacterium]|nr:hypothetical protein [Polyangiaceae bacterium]
MLQPRHRIPVPFEPRFVGSGPGCLSVLDVRRQRHLGVDLSTGEGGRCEAPFRAPGRGITGHSLSFQSGRERRYELCERGVCYTVEADSEGQQTLTARRGGSELWTIAVRHDRPHALALISADPVLVVLGRGVREGRVFPSSRVIALGIDPTTGREVWARAVGHSPVTLLHANGRFVVIAQGPPRQSGGLMTAIEPATGEVAWTLGGS